MNHGDLLLRMMKYVNENENMGLEKCKPDVSQQHVMAVKLKLVKTLKGTARICV